MTGSPEKHRDYSALKALDQQQMADFEELVFSIERALCRKLPFEKIGRRLKFSRSRVRELRRESDSYKPYIYEKRIQDRQNLVFTLELAHGGELETLKGEESLEEVRDLVAINDVMRRISSGVRFLTERTGFSEWQIREALDADKLPVEGRVIGVREKILAALRAEDDRLDRVIPRNPRVLSSGEHERFNREPGTTTAAPTFGWDGGVSFCATKGYVVSNGAGGFWKRPVSYDDALMEGEMLEF